VEVGENEIKDRESVDEGGNGGRTRRREGAKRERSKGDAARRGSRRQTADRTNGGVDSRGQELRQLLAGLRDLQAGEFTARLSDDSVDPVLAEINDAFNELAHRQGRLVEELTRVGTAVGREGRHLERASIGDAEGGWRVAVDSVNALIADLMQPTTEVARVIESVARGDLSQKMVLELEGKSVQGEFLRIGTTVNTMVDQLGAFASEVTRVAREVGTEGRLGGQASVPGVAGTWKDLTDNVNAMASNLTSQVRNIADVTTAVAKGDLSQKITVDVRGEVAELKDTINTMVDQLGAFASEVTRVAREVGTEGRLGGQANVPGVAGTWKDLTENVNAMASNLTNQVRNIAVVTTAVANGDLTQEITVDAKGEVAELKDTINTMVDQLSAFASEVTRVAREVGTEGRLGGQASVPGVGGTWKDLTDNVNFMAANLTSQVRNIADVTTAVARGDLSRKITVEVQGEIAELKNTINTMVDQLGAFASEVTRVAKEVGTEGKLGGQAKVEGVTGAWKDLTENVNAMASNLTVQLRDVSAVATAIANGDLTRKITVEARGEILQIKDVINKMVDSLSVFAGEVTRVAKEVGTEGKLGGQASVPGVAGTWKDLTENVNFMAGNLTAQVRNIADVTTAVAKGDLSRKITVEVKGEILELKNTINTMVDQLGSFADEVTRVAREVGTEGVLGGQARVQGVAGTWKDLTDSVNFMASNLTAQVRNIADVTTAVARGDLSQKITVDVKGEVLELKKTINSMVDSLRVLADELTRVAKEVGTEGKLGGQANVPAVGGTWKDLTENVNFMAGNLTAQVRNIADVTTAVARGDLSRKITVEVRGEILELKNTVNTMVDQLSSFASEVTRVAREVGTEGKLGGQANVPGVAGTWKDLTDNVNFMASNLTSQVRNIALVTTAVARGDLSQKITVDVRGEILELKNTINAMVDSLRVFADEVTRVAKEVGTEGKLGGQAEVPGAAGTWRALTDNVNAMANSLTLQVRAIADVATAVTKGDLTQHISVEAQGELDELKNNLNQMISNLRTTTEKNTEQDWLKTNLAKFSRMMQGQKDLDSVARLIMSELTPLVSAHHGAFYIMENEGTRPILKLIASYAYKERKHVGNRFGIGEGLVGQAALEKKPILLTNVPDDYIRITSGLGEAPPRNILVLPVLFEGEVKATVELASFLPFSQIHQVFLDQLAESIGVVLNMIAANMRTEELLEQSQKLAQELQSQSKELQTQQEELKRSNAELEAQAKSLRASEELLKDQQEELQQVNEELEEKASLLAEQNRKVEQKNQEVESARLALEEKADQLALSSRYKSEFLANMSHELRTPLNSLLILAKLLTENKEGNLSEKQIEFAHTILSSGTDLLNLINDVLDLSKVEAGKMEVEATDVSLDEIASFVERAFEPVAEQKGLGFQIEVQPDVPESVYTDAQRLQQVLKNLLSNAFKFTDRGQVMLTVRRADKTRRFANPRLDHAEMVVAFAVSDTGIGIAKENQRLIFEAFQQADGTTSRKYGGTGLGLSISREIARLLGGEIRVESQLGKGSTFTLFLPARYVDDPADRDPGRGSAGGRGRRTGSPGGPAGRPTPRALRPAPREPAGERPAAKSGRGRAGFSAFDDEALARTAARADRTEADFDDENVRSESGDETEEWRGGEAPDPTPVAAGAALSGEEQGTATAPTEMTLVQADEPTATDDWRPATPDGDETADAGGVATAPQPVIDDDRDAVQPGDRVVLIIENDPTFARVLLDMAREKRFLGIIALDGEEGIDLAHEFKPDAITLDIDMPGMDGWSVLDRLKHHPETRHIPVHIISGIDKRQQGLKQGAIAYLAKPVSKEALDDAFSRIMSFIDARVRNLLVVEDDEAQRNAMVELIAHEDVSITAVASAEEALAELDRKEYDCMVLDLGLADMNGFELLERVKSNPQRQDLPIIVYTGKELSPAEETQLRKYAETIIVKDVKSPERLLDETALFLHRIEAKLPEPKRRMLERLHNADGVFAGKRILIVDDDVRNIFSLTSVLEGAGMNVAFAENGKDALALLTNDPNFDLVLMDVMMPEMDGYETTQAIRRMAQFRNLPIIALTAKAMKGDREKCIAAGASDYITKPVDTEQLLSLMRVWLYR
jgi:HAMP domain-containing protein/CheY-like chemotaxis protein/signal transduction histidine kinase